MKLFIFIILLIFFPGYIFDERLDLYKTNKADFISIVDLLFSKTTLSIICLVMFFVMVVFTINKIKKLKRLSIDRNY